MKRGRCSAIPFPSPFLLFPLFSFPLSLLPFLPFSSSHFFFPFSSFPFPPFSLFLFFSFSLFSSSHFFFPFFSYLFSPKSNFSLSPLFPFSLFFSLACLHIPITVPAVSPAGPPSLPLTRACAFIILYYCPSSPLLPAPVLSPPFSPSAPSFPSPGSPYLPFYSPKATFFASFFKKPPQIFGGMEKSAYLCTRKRERDTPASQGL